MFETVPSITAAVCSSIDFIESSRYAGRGARPLVVVVGGAETACAERPVSSGAVLESEHATATLTSPPPTSSEPNLARIIAAPPVRSGVEVEPLGPVRQ